VLLLLGLVVPPVAVRFALPWTSVKYGHHHCIKQLGAAIQVYASDYDDKYPFHTNGFGDALILCLKHQGVDSKNYAAVFTAPGDDGQFLRDSMRNGTHVPEEQCTRAYVQGLSETNSHEICLVFDRYPSPGGDHRRRPFGGPMLREVCMLDGSMQIIPESQWPAFRTNQIELLVAAGIKRDVAEKLYAPYPRRGTAP
jgi:hypothetical protein